MARKTGKKTKKGRPRGASLTSELGRERALKRWGKLEVGPVTGTALQTASVAPAGVGELIVAPDDLMPSKPGDSSSSFPSRRTGSSRADGSDQEAAPDIVEFTTSPRYLGLGVSLPQRALLKACYGLPLDPEELEAFRQCTGRTRDPRTAFRTIVVIAGARAGKDSRFVAPCVLYEGVYGGHATSKGEGAVGALFAQDKDAAGVTLGYVVDYLTQSPALRRLVDGDPLPTIRPHNGSA